MRYSTLYSGPQARLLALGISFLCCAVAASQQWISEVETRTEGNYRYIRSNGIPDHPYGTFPNKNNPNAVSRQRHEYRVPLHPKALNAPMALGLQPFGIAVNGVPFDPGAAEFWNRDPRSGWQYEALSGKIDLGMDGNNAHVQPGGAYHYHGPPIGLLDKLPTKKGMRLLGYAADGFPIYGSLGYVNTSDRKSGLRTIRSSYRLKVGARPTGPGGRHDGTFVEDYEYVAGHGDLDECNGRYGVAPEFPEGTYYYVLTNDFPFIPRYFRGPPDESFSRRGPGPGSGRRPRLHHPPPEGGGSRPPFPPPPPR